MITLKNSSQAEATILSNLFIDHYMPEANGEFVKVYIYLVRTLSHAPVSFSLEQMADHLLCTEKDIVRALKYWAKTGILSLTYDSEKHLSDITLQSPASAAPEPKQAPVSSEKKAQPKPAVPETALTPDRVRELKENEKIKQIFFIAETYLGKTLSPMETDKLLFLYDKLKMSSALIEYLIEYCVSRNHRSLHYIERTAQNWADAGITTIEEAKAASSLYSKEYFTILKYLGISGQNPVEKQVAYMDTWLKTYGLPMELIQEACSRTLMQTGKPSFEYANRILKDWYDQKVHTLSEVQELDQKHKKAQPVTTPAKPQKTAPAQNRFNNFPQHEYNYDEIERMLLNR